MTLSTSGRVCVYGTASGEKSEITRRRSEFPQGRLRQSSLPVWSVLAEFYQEQKRWTDCEQQLNAAIAAASNNRASGVALARLYPVQDRKAGRGAKPRGCQERDERRSRRVPAARRLLHRGRREKRRRNLPRSRRRILRTWVPKEPTSNGCCRTTRAKPMPATPRGLPPRKPR